MDTDDKRKESQYYQVVRDWLQELLSRRFTFCHLEITANGRFSETLKAQVEQHREIIFHFLRETAPDVAGFVRRDHWREFVVVEVKPGKLKLEDVYQTKRYAELFGAPHALLVSAEEIPEEIKRLYNVAAVLSTMAGYHRITLVSLRTEKDVVSVVWFPNNPFVESS